jgi:NADH dehydrogenase
MGALHFHGLFAWLAWGLIHIAYLIGFRSKLGVMVEWMVIFFTGQRGVRLIRGSIDEDLPKA